MLPDKIRKKLWKPQKEAIDKMAEYIKAFQKAETTKSGLIHMPTGSGKTGIIACLARFADNIGNVLIVSPRIALRQQLFRETNSKFFEKIKFKDDLPKEVLEIDASNDFPKAFSNSTILITTIQKLHSLAGNNSDDFNELLSKIDLLIFDEGHYEPALSYSLVIRKFECPKVMFTATPFRNDFKPFNIDKDFIYSFPYHEAVKLNILRSVEVISKEPQSSPCKFIDDVLTEYDRIKKEVKDEEIKVIIRCDDSASIRNLATVLVGKGENFIAIHENFSQDGGESYECRSVPNPDDVEAKIWIHQYKLLEGVDDPKFRVLATFKPLSNTRQVIQQVGRIIRNPGKQENQFAYFIDHSGGIQKKLWEEYLDFDKRLTTALPLALNEALTNSVLNSLPPIEYVDGRFRRKFQLSEEIEDLLKEVSLPLNCNLIETLEDYSTEAFQEFLEDRFANDDASFRAHTIDEDTFLYFYISFNNTRFLAQKYFVDMKLNLCIFSKLSSGYLAFFDSTGFAPINYENIGLGKPLNPQNIKKLISGKDGSRLVNVSLKNSNLGNRSILSHSYSAASIDETTPFLDDHAKVLSSFVGYSAENDHPLQGNGLVRRYLGVGNGKLSEGKIVSLEEYLKWLEYIDSAIKNTKRKSINTFSRYSAESIDIAKTNPKHILLDFTEFEQLKYKDVASEKVVEFAELSSEVIKIKENGKEIFQFFLTEDTKKHQINISYDSKKKKYILSSSTLSGDYYTDSGEKIITYLNNNQLFRVIPEQNNTIYIHGNFYNPSIKIGSAFDEDSFHVGKIIHCDEKLGEIGSEKGTACKTDGSGWDKNTLFHLIDSLCVGTTMETHFQNPDILICDDLNTEVADFIWANPNKVVFIHVKGTGNKNTIHICSASSLQDVCAQAIKNIQFLSMFNDLIPPNLANWSTPWKSGHVTGTVKKRIRKGTGTPEEIWNKLQSRINNPLVDKEVWLFTGKILSKSVLISHLSKSKPVPEGVQAAILLHGTMTSVSSIGAKMRVFCYP